MSSAIITKQNAKDSAFVRKKKLKSTLNTLLNSYFTTKAITYESNKKINNLTFDYFIQSHNFYIIIEDHNTDESIAQCKLIDDYIKNNNFKLLRIYDTITQSELPLIDRILTAPNSLYLIMNNLLYVAM